MSGLALPYLLRLLGLSLALGLGVYAAAALLTALLAPRALGWAEASGAHLRSPAFTARAARVLLTLRLLPLVASVVVVGGWCIPSYLWLEPRGGAERVGSVFCLMAVGGVVLTAQVLRRLTGAAWASWRFVRRCQAQAELLQVPGTDSAALPVLVIAAEAPLLALAGIFRSRLLISRELLDRLSPQQLHAGISHEQAHRRTRDNFKRLLLIASPPLLPSAAIAQRFNLLERAWSRLSEWSADDAAVTGSASALTLASTLVAVARLGANPAVNPRLAVSHFVQPGKDRDLEQRVQRLLAVSEPTAPALAIRRWPTRVLSWAGALLLLGLMLQPTTLMAVHEILEHFIH